MELLLSLIAIVLAIWALLSSPRRLQSREDARLIAIEDQLRSLYERMHRLELALATRGPETTSEPVADVGTVVAPPPPVSVYVAPPLPPPRVPEPPVPQPASTTRATRDLEQRIGARWATWVGIVAILFGVSFFLKWSFDNDLIGPAGRVMLGCVAGVALLVAGLLLHPRRDLPFLSEGLAGGGLGMLYLSLFAAHALYNLLASGPTFAGMFAVTLAGAGVSVATRREATAVLAVLGGLLTPVLVRVPQPDERRLLVYLVVLDVLVLLIARFRTWPSLNRLAWVGTAAILSTLVLDPAPGPHPLARLILLTLLWAIFLAAPIWRERAEGRRGRELDLALTVANAAAYFAFAYWTLEAWQPRLEVPLALALAIVYRLIAADYARRVPDDAGTAIAYEGLAWTSLTIAFPLALDGRWVTLAWAVEGLVLIWAASRLTTSVAPLGGLLALTLAVARAGWLDVGWERVAHPVWNLTYLVHLLVVVVVASAGWLAGRARPEGLRGLARDGLRDILWVGAAGLLAVLLWREPTGLWPAGLLIAELLIIALLARILPAPAWAVATLLVGLVMLARVFVADDALARAAGASLVSAPLLVRILACVALAVAGNAVADTAGRADLSLVLRRGLPGTAAVLLLATLSLHWIRYQNEFALTARRARDFAEVARVEWRTQVGLSLLWTFYAAAALAWGFVRGTPVVRYGALALFGLTVVKVFLVDLAAVSTVYRVVSFLVLGVALLGVSALYQKTRRPAGR